MKRRTWLVAAAFASIFVFLPPLIFRFYPIPFWTAGEAELNGLGNALNLAYRLADQKMYSAIGMWDHPGVPFYLMSWLALAISGLPVAQSSGFFDNVIARVDTYQLMNIWLASAVGALAVFLFAREARKTAPWWVIAIGLLTWLVSTPWTLIAFLSPSTESFALLLNALSFIALMRVANDAEFSNRVTVFAACVSAFAYLSKLSFINLSLALACTGLVSLYFRRAGLRQWMKSSGLFVAVSIGAVLAVGYFVIGWNEFLHAVRFHKNVVMGSGLYGSGDEAVVSTHLLRDAISSIPRDAAWCLAIALPVGGSLLVGGLLSARKQLPTALVCIGTGLSSVLSAVSVLKHYDAHYTSAVSATLPACSVAMYMLAQAFGFRPALPTLAGAAAAIALMSTQIVPAIGSHIDSKVAADRAAQADMREIESLGIDSKTSIGFVYSVPSRFLGEGFSIFGACVPRLTAEYHRSRPRMFSTLAPDSPPRSVGAYVIHKGYFPTADSIKGSDNLAKFGGKPVTFREGDRIIELRTTFLLLREQ